MPRHPDAEAAAGTAAFGKNIRKRQLRQTQLPGCIREQDFFAGILKILCQPQKALMHALLVGHPEIGEPIINLLARAHETDGHHVTGGIDWMNHDNRLASIGVFFLAQRAAELTDGAAPLQAIAGQAL